MPRIENSPVNSVSVEKKEMEMISQSTVLLFGPLVVSDSAKKMAGGNREQKHVNERLGIMKFLSEKGYRIGLLHPSNQPFYLSAENRQKETYEGYLRFITRVSKTIPMVEEIHIPIQNMKNIHWIRDAMGMLGEKMIVNPLILSDDPAILDSITNLVPDGHNNIFISPMGEFGRVVPGSQLVFLSDTLKGLNCEVLFPQKVVYFPPDSSISKEVFDHIDIWVMQITNRKGELLVVLDKQYAQYYKTRESLGNLKSTCRQLGVKLKVITSNERSGLIANRIIQLPDAKVLVPGYNFDHKREIIDFVGQDFILETPTDWGVDPLIYLGSWRCSFTEVRM